MNNLATIGAHVLENPSGRGSTWGKVHTDEVPVTSDVWELRCSRCNSQRLEIKVSAGIKEVIRNGERVWVEAFEWFLACKCHPRGLATLYGQAQ